MEFKIDDVVEWVSQSAGVAKKKRGKVVRILGAGDRPDGVRNPGLPRDHVSYIVKVGSRRYWPRVSQLRSAP
jgi:hypothetical protein